MEPNWATRQMPIYRHGNKLYILCDDYLNLDDIPQGDGLLIIADAETMRKEKAYPREM